MPERCQRGVGELPWSFIYFEASREKTSLLGEFGWIWRVRGRLPVPMWSKLNKLNACVIFRRSMMIPCQEKKFGWKILIFHPTNFLVQSMNGYYRFRTSTLLHNAYGRMVPKKTTQTPWFRSYRDLFANGFISQGNMIFENYIHYY